MFKRKNLHTALVVTTLASASFIANAQQTTQGTASITVANAFTLAETTPLNLGTFRVTHNVTGAGCATNGANIQFNADGTYNASVAGAGANTDCTSSINLVTAGTPGVFTISAAAPNTAMQLDLPQSGIGAIGDQATPAEVTELTNFGNAAAIFYLTLDEQVSGLVQVTSGPAAGAPYNDASSNLVTDGTGTVSFAFGGVVETSQAAAATFAGPYPDGTYDGQFDVTVSY